MAALLPRVVFCRVLFRRRLLPGLLISWLDRQQLLQSLLRCLIAYVGLLAQLCVMRYCASMLFRARAFGCIAQRLVAKRAAV